MRSELLRDLHLSHEVSEASVGAQGVEGRINFEKHQDEVPPIVSLFEPRESFSHSPRAPRR